MLRKAFPCECEQESAMGQKRDKLCPCGNVFEKVNPDGSRRAPKPRTQLRPVSEKRAAEEAAGARAHSRGSTLKQGKGMQASPAQRAKVKGTPCVACGREASAYVSIDPAHVWPQGKGGCADPDCVLGLCRGADYSCHRLFDQGELDLLSRVSDRPEAFAVELAHPIRHHGVTLVELVRRLAGNREELVWVSREAA